MKRIQAIRRNRAAQRKAVLDRALERLSGFAEPLGLELIPFGSYAKDRVRSQSDLDLAIPGNISKEARRKLEREAERVEVDEGIPIDLMFESEIPAYFRELRDTLSNYRSSLGGVRSGKREQSVRTTLCLAEENPMPNLSPVTVFEEIEPKLERISADIDNGKKYLSNINMVKNLLDPESVSWGQGHLLAYIVHNMYNGIEDILEDIAKVDDEFNPSSASSHSDLISLMATETQRRPAILTPELHAILDDLRKFRHVARHGYGKPFRTEEVQEKFDLFQRIFLPKFLESLERYKAHIQSAPNPDIE